MVLSVAWQYLVVPGSTRQYLEAWCCGEFHAPFDRCKKKAMWSAKSAHALIQTLIQTLIHALIQTLILILIQTLIQTLIHGIIQTS